MKVVGVAWIDGRNVGIDDRLDWIDGIAEVANRIDIHRVIDLS